MLNYLGPTTMAVLDLNGDGKADLLMGTYIPIYTLQYGISVAFGNGDGHSDGTFSSPVLTPLANQTSLGSYKLVSGDLNGDGKLDIVAVTSTGYAVLLGNGKGGFSAQEYTRPGIPST